MRISFPFLRAKDLRAYLLIMRTCIFFNLVNVGDTNAKLVYTWYKNIFRTIAVFIVFFQWTGEKESDENNTKTRQRRDRDRYETVLLLAMQ